MQLDTNIITRCKQQDRKAQQTLYDKYSALFFGICLRYMKVRTEAEDVLIESFFKIFSKINQFQDKGSFEGWMKRIVVNECLMAIRKKNNLNLHLDIEDAYYIKVEPIAEMILSQQEILELVEQLPVGYRTIFNLFVIEGYKHREIAEKLGISINTSKSQLILAKKKLKDLYKKKQRLNLNSNNSG